MKKPDFQHDILPMRDALQRVAFGITRVQEEAEDAVQDTMLRVWAQRERWHE
ncbi:MAG: RNA polymerase subunit sigma-70, partial [Bacteroidaceae bacterium]|nr:RNA polymerase subunit sigma-70 [Bacteroidaceae bacterium]